MEPPEVSARLERRRKAYEDEEEVLGRKFNNDDVPSGKKERIYFRLKDIQNRLLPDVLRRIQSFS